MVRRPMDQPSLRLDGFRKSGYSARRVTGILNSGDLTSNRRLPMLSIARIASVLILVAAGATHHVAANSDPRRDDPVDLTVHEWGTFTTVAGADGRAIDWLPLGGPTDLPCFVEHFQNRRDFKLSPNQPMPLDYAAARANLWGKVRMETPVLYFYAPRRTTIGVQVRFPRGLMTEWYPRATVSQPFVTQPFVTGGSHHTLASVIGWPNVVVAPEANPRFPVGRGESHYYAARNTDAAPLLVNGQQEKFLFYRGVASFDVPLAARALNNGATRILNLGRDEIRGVILFENRGGAIGYRVIGTLRGEVTAAAPPRTRTVADLRRELERMLIAAGLYPREATAMIDSWRDSWFEPGTRVFYIVPSRAVDAILPLTVTPAPTRVARVFVGRMEVISSDIERSVEKAIVTRDASVLARYGRFLGPITDRILSRHSDARMRDLIGSTARAAFDSYRGRVVACE